MAIKQNRLQNRQQLDIKHQRAVRRDTTHSLTTVGQFAWHIQAPLAAYRHQLQGFGPAGNHAGYRKLGGLATLVRAVKYGAVNQGTEVMGAHSTLANRLVTLAGGQDV